MWALLVWLIAPAMTFACATAEHRFADGVLRFPTPAIARGTPPTVHARNIAHVRMAEVAQIDAQGNREAHITTMMLSPRQIAKLTRDFATLMADRCAVNQLRLDSRPASDGANLMMVARCDRLKAALHSPYRSEQRLMLARRQAEGVLHYQMIRNRADANPVPKGSATLFAVQAACALQQMSRREN